jgi:transcriptional regulator with XRE-family HTH domain
LQSKRLFRIGEKLISLDKAVRLIERTLELREKGISQQEAARKLQLDRSFVSRLEAIGEIRKGNRVAVIAFPLSNTAEITEICSKYGLDFYLLLNNQERWDMVRDQQALDFFNRMLELVARLREFDTLIMVTSEKWYHLAEALLDIQIIYISLGSTPIQEDRKVDPKLFEDTLKQIL